MDASVPLCPIGLTDCHIGPLSSTDVHICSQLSTAVHTSTSAGSEEPPRQSWTWFLVPVDQNTRNQQRGCNCGTLAAASCHTQRTEGRFLTNWLVTLPGGTSKWVSTATRSTDGSVGHGEDTEGTGEEDEKTHSAVRVPFQTCHNKDRNSPSLVPDTSWSRCWWTSGHWTLRDEPQQEPSAADPLQSVLAHTL